MRISFTGDISLDKPMLAALKARTKALGRDEIQTCDFVEMFQGCRSVFAGADYVVGNLETVFGGGNAFNTKTLHYNSPDAFATAIKDAGINVLTTANNHSFDEGASGIDRTLDILDREGILHTGTFRKEEKDRILYIDQDGIKIAILAYTYGVNPCKEADSCDEIERMCNLFQPYKKMYAGISRIEAFARKVIFTREFGRRLRILLKKPTVKKHVDHFHPDSFREDYLERIKCDLKEANDAGADYSFVCLHSGGQFNEEPGEFTEHVMEAIAAMGNCTAIIGNHPHIIQKIEKDGGVIKAFSLGGLTLSPDATYVSSEAIPEYSLVLHFDITKTECKFSYNIMHGIPDEDGYLRIQEASSDSGNTRLNSVKKRIAGCTELQ